MENGVNMKCRAGWLLSLILAVLLGAMTWKFIIAGQTVRADDGRTVVLLTADERNKLLQRVANAVVQRREEGASEGREEGEVYLKGDLTDLSVLELIELLRVSRKTSRAVLTQGRDQGSVVFDEGEIVDAELGEVRGVEALKSLVGWTAGSFMVKGLERKPEQTIEERTDVLLMDLLMTVGEDSEDADPSKGMFP